MRKFIKISGLILLSLLLVIMGLAFYLQTDSGQKFVTKQVSSYLKDKVKTPFNIQNIKYHVPDWVELQGVYFADQNLDTLIAGQSIYVNIDMLDILNSKININELNLKNIKLNLNRSATDSVFNYVFLLNSFSKNNSPPIVNDTTIVPFTYKLAKILLNNISLKYRDDVEGIDANIGIKNGQTSFSLFDPNHSKYHFNKVLLNTGNINLRLFQSIVPPKPTTISDPLSLSFNELDAKNLNLKYTDENSGLLTSMNLGQLFAKSNSIDLIGQKIHLNALKLLNTDALVSISNNKKQQNTNTENTSPWDILIDKVNFDSNNLKYKNLNAQNIQKGINYNDLEINNLKVNSERIHYSPNQITGWIYNGSFKEKSGFDLKNLQTDFEYSDKQAFLKKLLIQTSNSIVKDEIILKYNAVADLTNNIGIVKLNSTLKNSEISFKDLLLLFPEYANSKPFKGNENALLKIDGRLSGPINNLALSQSTISGLGSSKLTFDGNISGLPNANNVGMNLNIKELFLTKADLINFVPTGSIPSSIELPQHLLLAGKINGSIDNLQLNTTLKSDLGDAKFVGQLTNITANINQKYNGDISLNAFDLGKFLKNPAQFGKVTLTGKIQGEGFDTQSLNAAFEGTINQAEYQGYNYKNLNFFATLNHQLATVKGTIIDPNINLIIDSKFDLSKEFPSVKGNVRVNELNLKNLGLYKENIDFSGNIEVDMPATNPENPTGSIFIKNGTLIQNGKPIEIEDVYLNATNNYEGKTIVINAPFMHAKLIGNYNYLQIPDIFITTINRYFEIPGAAFKPVSEPYNLSIDLKVVNHPIIKSFLPLLTRLDTSRFTAQIDSKAEKILIGNLLIPNMEYDTIKVKNIKLDLVGGSNKLTYNSSLDGVIFTGFQVRKTNLNGEISNNIANFKATFKDAENKTRNELNGLFLSADNQFRVKLNNGGLLLNYSPWQVDSTGYIEYGNKGLLVNNINIKKGNQKLTINSTSLQPNGPLLFTTDSLKIQNFVSLFSTDSTLAAGKIDGNILVSNYTTEPNFKGDLTINDFYYKNAAIGNLTMNVYNESTSKIVAKATLLNEQNDVVLSGNYYLNSNDNLDMNLIINKLSTESIAAFSDGEIKNGKGQLAGQATIKGSIAKPQIDGKLGFEKVVFDLKSFGGRYKIDNQNILFDHQKVHLNEFVLSDTLDQKMTVNGTVLINNMPSINYDLVVTANNFLALNSTRKDNDLIYGKGIVDADLTISGISQKVRIDGDLKIKENSNISVIIPNDYNDIEQTEGVVIFIDKDNQKNNVTQNDTLRNNVFVNDFINEISLNIDADEKSDLTLVIDEINGDALKVKGNGKLNAGINNNGQPYILGSYDLTEGSYGITFEIIKKQFEIEKGSSIIWSGDPLNGEVNITAIYKVNTSPYELMVNETTNNSDFYRQKMNFDVQLTMSGKLASLNPTFKILLSEEQRLVSNDIITKVKAHLDAINKKENIDEVNKQVFALLILNRFFSEKSSDFFSTNVGNTNAAAFARQSVSKLLSDQLNQIASGLFKGVNLDVNLSSSLDYFNGVSSARTDLNLGLSKALFNDKVEIKVGRNFELENNTNITRNPSEIFDNLMVNYKLSDDGKFLFKAFRKNQFQSVLEGFIVETGVGFSISKDYTKIGDLFLRKKNNVTK